MNKIWLQRLKLPELQPVHSTFVQKSMDVIVPESTQPEAHPQKRALLPRLAVSVPATTVPSFNMNVGGSVQRVEWEASTVALHSATVTSAT